MDCIETGNKEASSLPLTVNSGGSGGGPDLERRDEAEDGATAVAADATLLEKTAAACAEPAVPDEPQQTVDIKVIYNKTKYEVSVSLGSTVGELKRQLVGLLGVPEKNQKLMFKGLLRDDQSLSSAGVTRGSKLMVVGSKPTDIMAVTSVRAQELQQELERPTTSKEPLSKQKIHRKILDKGVPEDAMPGIKNAKEALPGVPLSGMLNKHGGKLRLTFKLEQDQLWLGTKERTEKLAMSSIKSIVSEPIDGHEQYHIMGIQLGPTEASRYWLYWVPAQYVDAIKDAILGKWQYF